MTSDRMARHAKRAQARVALQNAARSLLEERVWPDITVDDLTTAAGLSRTAFYQHFPDRQALLMSMLDDVAPQLEHVADEWLQVGTDPINEHRRSLARLTQVWTEHGRLLRAVADAAVADADVAASFDAVARHLHEMTARAIERDVANGHAEPVENPLEVARALSWMTERYLRDSLGSRPFSDPDAVASTLALVWTRTLYPSAT